MCGSKRQKTKIVYCAYLSLRLRVCRIDCVQCSHLLSWWNPSFIVMIVSIYSYAWWFLKVLRYFSYAAWIRYHWPKIHCFVTTVNFSSSQTSLHGIFVWYDHTFLKVCVANVARNRQSSFILPSANRKFETTAPPSFATVNNAQSATYAVVAALESRACGVKASMKVLTW